MNKNNIDWTGYKTEKGKRPLLYMVLDCETATLPLVDSIAKNAKDKRKLAIAKPLIYDFAYRIIDRYNRIYLQRNFLVTEIFAIPSVFNTAYYKEKRPIYLEMLRNNEITLTNWDHVISFFDKDLKHVDFVGAYNSMFDFKKAIPFTNTYINNLYSTGYELWEEKQRRSCYGILKGGHKDEDKPAFDRMNYQFRAHTIPLIDIWGISCQILVNNNKYKNKCLEHNMITNSGEFFKTSAETTFRHLEDTYNFVEKHTALEDVKIESEILCKALKRKQIPLGIVYFPFRQLGKTTDYLYSTKRGIKPEHYDVIINQMAQWLTECTNPNGAFASRIRKEIDRLEEHRDNRFVT